MTVPDAIATQKACMQCMQCSGGLTMMLCAATASILGLLRHTELLVQPPSQAAGWYLALQHGAEDTSIGM